MKKQGILLVVLIVLAGLAFFISKNKNKSTIDEELKNISIKDTSSIDKIFIAEKTGQKVLLERNEKKQWMVNGKYQARMDAIELLLYTFLRTEVKYLPGEKAKETIILSIATEGKKVEVYQNGKRSKIWYIGSTTPDQTGTFMVMADPETDQKSSQPIITHIPGFEGFLNTRFFTDEEDWRDRTLLSVAPSNMKSVKMEYPQYPDSSFQIELKDLHHFNIRNLSNQPFAAADTAAIKQYLAYFLDLSAELYLNSHLPLLDSLRRTNYFAELTVVDKQGKENQLRFYHKKAVSGKEEVYGKKVDYDPDNVYISYNKQNDFAMGQYFTYGKTFQSARYFYPKAVKK